MARPDDAAAMTVMQRASWLAAYGGVLGEDMLAQLAVTEHLQIWRRRLAETGPRPMLSVRTRSSSACSTGSRRRRGDDGADPRALPASRSLASGPWQAAVAGGGGADAPRRL
jgi:hypothetical protein